MGMIDVSEKKNMKRTAVAQGRLKLRPETLEAMNEGKIRKGNPLPVAEAAGMLAVKQTPNIIPHCHPLPISSIDFEFKTHEDGIAAICSVGANYKTGVEMDALAGLTVSLLTVWDMVKYLEKDQEGQYPETEITDIRIIKKLKEE